MNMRKWLGLAAAALVSGTAAAAPPPLPLAPKVTTPRLYALDCGTILDTVPEAYQMARRQVSSTTMTVLCFLIVHPKGTLLWDTGVADRYFGPEPVAVGDRGIRFSKTNTLVGQLAQLGYAPGMITYLSHSHHHLDHTGNSNTFAATATWLVSKAERDAMFDTVPPPSGHEDNARLRSARTILVGDNYDVFGDGSVVIVPAPGHTPGHSVLQVSLAKSGPVILAGDLWHYPEEMVFGLMPKAEETRGTPEARAKIVALAKALKAPIWPSHDREVFRNLPKAPAYRE